MVLRPAILLAFLLALPVSAQEEDPAAVEHTKIVSVTAEPATVKWGDTVTLTFKLRIDPEWHIYAANGSYAPTEWKFNDSVERAGAIVEPPPKDHREALGDGNFLTYSYHEGEVTFRVPVRVKAASGPFKIEGKITGQECDPRICITLDLPFAVDVKVEPHTRIASVAPDPPQVKPGEAFHVVFKVAIDPGWHIYSAIKEWTPTRIEFEGAPPFERTGPIEEQPPAEYTKHRFGKEDSEGFIEYWKHEREVTFKVSAKLGTDIKPGPLKVKGRLLGVECATSCVDLELPFETEVVVEAAAPQGQEQDLERHTRIVSVTAEPAAPKVGETFQLVFNLRIDPTWHIYSANGKYGPTEWTFDGPVERVGQAIEPPTKHHREQTGDVLIEYDYLEGNPTIRVPVRLTGEAKPGPLAIKGRMKGTECDPNVCITMDVPFELGVTVNEGGVAVDSEYEKHGFMGLLVLGVLGGLISLVMPCTYPMIPITLTYFVKQAAGSRGHGLVLSSFYALGIVLAFTGLGFLLTILLGAGGAREFAANPWVNIVVGLLFLWFTGSLFGWYEIKLPFGLGTRLTQGQHQGVGGAFILGLLFSVVTFTCTIPIAGTILTIAAGQHRLAAALAMLFYSLTMAVPFFLMGLFPAAIRDIPRSGGWLQTTKITMAWVELGLATFYFSKADQTWEIGGLNRPVMLALWILVALIAAGYLLGMFRARPGLISVAFAAGFLGFGGYMGYGYSGKPLGILEILVPPPAFEGTTLPAALAEGKKLNKPVFAEFTGVT